MAMNRSAFSINDKSNERTPLLQERDIENALTQQEQAAIDAEQERLNVVSELIQESPTLRAAIEGMYHKFTPSLNMVEKMYRYIKLPATVMLETAGVISIWAMLDNNFEGWPETYRRRADQLDEKMLYVYASACFINIAHAIKTKNISKINAAIEIAHSFMQSVNTGFSTANLAEDTMVSVAVELANSGSGSVSGSDGMFWRDIFAPAVTLGFAHWTMEFGESIVHLGKKYGFDLGEKVKGILPEKFEAILGTAYTYTRSGLRGTFVTGGIINQVANTLIQDLLKINLANYASKYRTILFTAPHIIGLAIEFALKKYASEKTQRAVNYGFMLTSATVYMYEYFDDYLAGINAKDDHMTFMQKFSPVFAWTSILGAASLANQFYKLMHTPVDSQPIAQQNLLLDDDFGFELIEDVNGEVQEVIVSTSLTDELQEAGDQLALQLDYEQSESQGHELQEEPILDFSNEQLQEAAEQLDLLLSYDPNANIAEVLPASMPIDISPIGTPNTFHRAGGRSSYDKTGSTLFASTQNTPPEMIEIVIDSGPITGISPLTNN